MSKLQQSRRSSRFLIVGSLGTLLACGANDVLPPAAPSSIRIDPAALTMERGNDAILRLLDQSGSAITYPAARWSSDRPGIVSVTASGGISANGAGVGVISAVVGNQTATATITVADSSAGVVASVTLDAARSFVWTGDTLTLGALVRNRWGEALPAALAWTSSTPAVASVSAEGFVRGLAAGSAKITATSGTIADSRVILVEAISSLSLEGTTVLVPGTEAPLTLVARSDSLAGDVGASWRSSDPSVATVSAAGVVKGVGEGTATIGATHDDTTLIAAVTVRALGGRILFQEEGGPKLLRLDGSAAIPLPVFRVGGSLVISPDGREVAYECPSGICRMSLDGTGVPSSVIAGGTFPSWTGDSRALAARTSSTEVTIASTQSDDVRLLPLSFYIERPRISPDGLHIAFECDYTEPYEAIADLCIASTAGSRLESVVAGATLPAWSPDGQSISYMRASVLCVAPLIAPANCTRIFSIPFTEVAVQAAWSPDGAHLVVARADGLWVVEPSGANPLVLRPSTSGAGRFANPSWGADPR